jgi:copper chaperone CopZ
VSKVPEISCEHCVRAINEALSALPGVEQVSTDISTKTVALRYDPGAVTMERIQAALDDEGNSVAGQS